MEEENIYDFICKGPILEKMGSNPKDVTASLDLWTETGTKLREFLRCKDTLTEPQKIRIYHYYLPVYIWCHRQLIQYRASFKDTDEIPPFVFGISAPQGCGKSTLVSALDFLFNSSGRKSASVSIDDFYLAAADKARITAENKGNTLLELRGNAGTHDLALGASTLKSLCSLTKEGLKMKIPRYDKSANNGQGDRADPSSWPEIEGPLEVIFLEGWMLGFRTLPTETVRAVDPQLEAVNKHLEPYHESWEKFINSWIVVKIDNCDWIYKWRLQAEISMKNEGKPGMTEEQVFDFVTRYMPAYKAYLPVLYSDGPCGADPEHTLIVEIDQNRNPTC